MKNKTVVANHNPNLVLVRIWNWEYYFEEGEIYDVDIEKLPIAAWVISQNNENSDNEYFDSIPVPGTSEFGSNEDFIILDTLTGWWSHPYVDNGHGEESLRRYLTKEAIRGKASEERRKSAANLSAV